jgi:hypothetical protein
MGQQVVAQRCQLQTETQKIRAIGLANARTSNIAHQIYDEKVCLTTAKTLK